VWSTYRSPGKLEAFHLFQRHPGIFRFFVLDKCITFTATRHWIPVQVNKLKFAKGLKDLSDIGFGEVEMQGANV
jgi:hypothetical protein